MERGGICRAFQMFDQNGDGKIAKKELSHSLENLGIVMADKELVKYGKPAELGGVS